MIKEKKKPVVSEEKTVGSVLKEARLKQKREIKTAANKLCIRKVYLEALESDDVSVLPGQTYTIGFLKSYAAYLRLNPEKIVAAYLAENPLPQPETSTKTDDTVPLYENMKYRQIQYLLYILLILIGIFTAYALFSFFSGSERDSSDVLEGEIVPLPQEEILEPTLSVISSESTASVVDSSEVSNVKPVSAGTLKPEELQVIPSVSPDKIVLLAEEDTWIELLNRKTGNVIFSRILNKGEKYEMKENVHVSLTVGNAGGLAVYVLGENVGKFGPSGVRRSHIRMDANSIGKRIEKKTEKEEDVR